MLFLAFLYLQKPLWEAYLLLPNRELLMWDPALHFLEGIQLYQSIIAFDFISFFHHLFSLSFWLPTHRLLVLVIQFFSPYQVEPIVALNFVLVAAALASLPFILCRQFEGRLVATFTMVLLSLSLFSGLEFAVYHGSIMLESLSFALGVLFFGFSARALQESKPWAYRGACVTLLALLMCKIHYGLFVLPMFGLFFWTRIWKTSLPVSWKSILEWVGSLFRKTYFRVYLILLLVCAVLIIGQVMGFVSIESYRTTTWPFFFFPVFVWGVEWWNGRNPIVSRMSQEGRFLHHWVLFPFALYYLFPGYSKINYLFYNVAQAQSVSFSMDSLKFYFDAFFHGFFGFQGIYPGLFLVLLMFLTLVFSGFRSLREKNSKPFVYLGLQIGICLVLSTLMDRGMFYRLSFLTGSGVVVFVTLTSIVVVLKLTDRFPTRRPVIISLLAIAGIGLVFHGNQQVRGADRMPLAARMNEFYLSKDFLNSDAIFRCLDPKQSAWIAGLGNHQAAPYFRLWSTIQNPKSSLVFSDETQWRLGPFSEVLVQGVFFHWGKHEKLYSELLELASDQGWQVLEKSQYTVITKKECPSE